jgi:ATP-binding cassette subfamily F protein 3
MIEADGGNINMTGRMRIGSVPQDPPAATSRCSTPCWPPTSSAPPCWPRTRPATTAAAGRDPLPARRDRRRLGARRAPASILHGLGFDNEPQGRPCGEFSGGWRMRVALAGTLFSDPDLLILDEPSNHLDLEAMLWLTEHLQRFRHTLLMVSHDRDLLNDVCDHIVHIDQQKLVTYNGNYDRSSAPAPSGSSTTPPSRPRSPPSASTCRPSSTASRPRRARRARRSRASR